VLPADEKLARGAKAKVPTSSRIAFRTPVNDWMNGGAEHRERWREPAAAVPIDALREACPCMR
jgi:hypothetical protein